MAAAVPPKSLTAFEMLTSQTEANPEILYPIHFFQSRIEKGRSLNTFVRAYEKG